MFDPARLSKKVRSLFGDTETTLLLSAASVWEIALKAGKGKIDVSADSVDQAILAFQIKEVPVRFTHVRRASLLRVITTHKDPFDRLIVAQALSERVPLVTNDSLVRQHYKELAIIW